MFGSLGYGMFCESFGPLAWGCCNDVVRGPSNHTCLNLNSLNDHIRRRVSNSVGPNGHALHALHLRYAGRHKDSTRPYLGQRSHRLEVWSTYLLIALNRTQANKIIPHSSTQFTFRGIQLFHLLSRTVHSAIEHSPTIIFPSPIIASPPSAGTQSILYFCTLLKIRQHESRRPRVPSCSPRWTSLLEQQPSRDA